MARGTARIYVNSYVLASNCAEYVKIERDCICLAREMT